MRLVLGVAALFVMALIFSLEFTNYRRSDKLSTETGELIIYPPPPASYVPQPSPNKTDPATTESTPYRTLTLQATSTPMVDENGWYIYNDREAGFSLSYPPELVSFIAAGSKHVQIAFRLKGG